MRPIGLAVVLTLSLAIAPVTADGQQAEKVWRIGFLPLQRADQVIE